MSNNIGRFEIQSEITHSEIVSVYKAADAVSPVVSPGDGSLAYLMVAPTQDVLYVTGLVVQPVGGQPREIPSERSS